MKLISVRLPEKLIVEAKVHAAKRGTTMQVIVAEALKRYLKEERKETK